MDDKTFVDEIFGWYIENKRDLAFRDIDDPYKVLVSEIMLQQTQIPRVVPKYAEFIACFPTIQGLAQAEQREVLRVWKGLGYNRRALALHRIAKSCRESGIPHDPEELETLPGIGPATARSIAVFAFNEPYVFIETNIRRVFIHFFYPDKTPVADRELIPLVERTMDREDPRQWYYALMDYGTMLRSKVPNPNKRSAHYARQKPFAGSDRWIRGQILTALLEQQSTRKAIAESLKVKEDRVQYNLDALEEEGFIERSEGTYVLR